MDDAEGCMINITAYILYVWYYHRYVSWQMGRGGNLNDLYDVMNDAILCDEVHDTMFSWVCFQ